MKQIISCRCGNPIGIIDLIDNCSKHMSVSFVCSDCDKVQNNRLTMGGVSF